MSKTHRVYVISIPCPCMHIYIIGLTTPSSTFSSDMPTTVSEPLSTIRSDMSTTVSEPQSTISSDMSTTVSEVPPPPVTTSSAELSQEKVIAIVIFSALAAGALILLVVLVVRQCRRKNKGTPVKNKENHFANKQNNLIKKADLKSYKPRKFKLSKKRNEKLGSTSLDKKKDAQLENFACKDGMYQHYPQTNDCWNNYGNQHVFNISHNEGNMMFYGNWHDNYLRPHTRLNNRMLYQSHYPEYPGHNEGMFQYRADNLYRGQQMYQRPYGALYDMHIINDKQNDKGRPYEKNWDLLY